MRRSKTQLTSSSQICYQKKRSMDVALKKLRAEDGEQIEKQLECLLIASESDEDDIFITQKDRVAI